MALITIVMRSLHAYEVDYMRVNWYRRLHPEVSTLFVLACAAGVFIPWEVSRHARASARCNTA